MSVSLGPLTPPDPTVDPWSFGLWCFILACGVGAVGWYGYHSRRLSESIVVKSEALNSVEAGGAIESLSALQALFAEDPLLKPHWAEFEASLVSDHDAGTVLTTSDAGAFFNEVSLVDQPLKLEFSRHVPGMLTALGIVGTFGGLIGGLADFKRTNLEISIQNLLEGIHSAFAVSFLAILFAVIVTATERYVCTKHYGQVHTLRERLNRRFNRTLTDGYLKDISNLSDQTAQTLKSFSQDLSEAIRAALEQLVAQQTEEMTKANALIANQVKDALKEVMDPAVKRMAEAVEVAQQQNASSSQDALRDLVTQFGETMQNTAGQQMDGLMAAIAGSTTTMTALRDEMGGLLGALRTQLETQQAASTQQLEALTRHAAEQQEAMRKELRAFVSETAQTLQDLQQQMVTQSGESVAGVGAELTRLVATFQQRQEEALERLETRVHHMHGELDKKLTQVVSELGESTRTSSTAMQGAVQQTVRSLHDEHARLIGSTQSEVAAAVQAMAAQTGQVTQASANLSQRLEAQTQGMHAAVQALIAQSQATHGDVAAQQARYAAQLTEAMGALQALMSDFDARIVRHRGMVDEMAAALGAARGAGEQIAAAAGRYADTQGRVDDLLMRVTDHTALLQQEVGALRQFNQQLDGTVRAHGEALGRLRTESEQFMQAVNGGVRAFGTTVDESMLRYHQVARDGLKELCGHFDEHLAKAVQMLGGTIEELDDYLDRLTERLKERQT